MRSWVTECVTGSGGQQAGGMPGSPSKVLMLSDRSSTSASLLSPSSGSHFSVRGIQSIDSVEHSAAVLTAHDSREPCLEPRLSAIPDTLQSYPPRIPAHRFPSQKLQRGCLLTDSPAPDNPKCLFLQQALRWAPPPRQGSSRWSPSGTTVLAYQRAFSEYHWLAIPLDPRCPKQGQGVT